MVTQAPPDQWTKIEKIRYLLDQWDTIHDPDVCSPFGSPGDGTGVQLMPLMSRHPSVLELGRALGLLLWANPGDYRHLIAYRQCEWRVVWVNTRIRGPRGKIVAGEPKPERRPVARAHHPWRLRHLRLPGIQPDRCRGEGEAREARRCRTAWRREVGRIATR